MPGYIVKWDRYFIQEAMLVSTLSKDPSTQVGCVLVKDRQVVSKGYNGGPRGYPDELVYAKDKEHKYTYTVHAELNAIINAARLGLSTLGCSLYVTPLYPCVRCAIHIVQAGIVEVGYHCPDNSNQVWLDSFNQARDVFSSCGVSLRPLTL